MIPGPVITLFQTTFSWNSAFAMFNCLFGSLTLKRFTWWWAAMITWSPEGQAPLDCPHPLLNTLLRQIQHPLSFSYRSIMCPNFKTHSSSAVRSVLGVLAGTLNSKFWMIHHILFNLPFLTLCSYFSTQVYKYQNSLPYVLLWWWNVFVI